ncbi:MAG TPA: hypothetical protein VD886_26415 [Herpetosiphonaceae bacterium]|nr:hypothetical protein [Herpetosiphonaceae bacterium]
MALRRVDTAFDQVLSEIEAVNEKLANQGSAAFQEQSYDTTLELSQLGASLAELREKLAGTRQEWSGLSANLAPVLGTEDEGRTGLRAAIASLANSTLLIVFILLVAGQSLLMLNTDDKPAPRNMAGLALHGLALAFAWWSGRGATDQETAATPPLRRTRELIVVVGLVAFAALARTLWLSNVPYILDGDTSAFADSARNFIPENDLPLFDTGWQGHTNLYFYMLSWPLRWFGQTIIGVRIFGAVGGTLAVLCMYWMGRSLYGWRIGLLAGLVTATLPFHLVFSRVGTEVVHLTWLMPLVITLIWHGWRLRSPWWLVAGGLVTGLSQYFYPGARLIPLLCGAQIAALTVFPTEGSRQWRQGFKALAWIVLGFVVIYAPMIAYYLKHTEAYMVRFKTVSITGSGWLERELANRSAWDVLSKQVKMAYSPFVYPTNGSRFWFMDPEYLSPVNAALLVLGLASLGARRVIPRWLGVYLAFYLIVGMFVGGVLTIDTPMPSRYTIFVPAVVLLISISLNRLFSQFEQTSHPATRRLMTGLASLLLLLYAAANLRAYVRHDTETIWQVSIQPQIATAATRYLISLPNQDYSVLYLSEGLNYYRSNPSLRVLTGKDGVDIEANTPCDAMADHMPPGQVVIIAPPARIEELGSIKARIIGAEATIMSNKKGEPIAGTLRFNVPPEGIRPYLCGGQAN